MAGLKSLEELKALRDKYSKDVAVRETTDPQNKIRVAVGMATCGIASGSRETINAIVDEIGEQHMENVTVVQAGCMGYCYAEPTVEVRVPGREPVLYGNIDAERGRELVRKHLKEGTVLKDFVLEKTFDKI